jgi:TolB protein
MRGVVLLVSYGLSVLVMLWSLTANAELELELTQGIDSAIPLAVVRFSQKGSQVPRDTPKLSAIIRADLVNSGQFRVVSATKLSTLSGWRKRGVDEVLEGSVHYSPTGVEVNVTLTQTQGKSALIFKRQYRIKPAQWRALAHRISDEVYLALTGDKGNFSTRMAYILHLYDGKQHRYMLKIADADGQNAKVLVSSGQPIMSPTWSPGGKEVAYVSFERARAAVYRAEVATGKRKLISHFPGINGAPSWSPDGKQLAVVLSKSGYPKLYLVNLANHALIQLTHGWSIDTEPSWSADGNRVLFTSNRGGSPQIYQIELATQAVSRISFDGNYNARASYSRDGKSIVMQHRDKKLFSIAVLDVGTGYLRVITQGGIAESPSIAPNGKMVLYATRLADRRVLSLVSIDGRVQLRLPAQTGEVQEPAWSPFLV